MAQRKVFISSVIGELAAEREAAREAIESFGAVFTAWAFEREPASTKPLRDSFIEEVKESDLFVLIVGCKLTRPVEDEITTAEDYDKPILVFVKEAPCREPDAARVLGRLEQKLKYASFTDAADLRQKVREALAKEILRWGEPDSGVLRPGDRLAQLRDLARRCSAVRVMPMVPPCQYDQFSIVGVTGEAVNLEKHSNQQSLALPISRVVEILPGGQGEPPVLHLDGRLQWLTLKQVWRFFPERPDPSDPLRLGLAREAGRHEPFVLSLGHRLETQGLRVVWSCRDKLADRLVAGTHQVFYDEDGRYLLSAGAVLLISPVRQ